MYIIFATFHRWPSLSRLCWVFWDSAVSFVSNGFIFCPYLFSEFICGHFVSEIVFRIFCGKLVLGIFSDFLNFLGGNFFPVVLTSVDL